MNDDLAKKRLWIMTGVRLAGLGILFFGLWLLGRAEGRSLWMAAGLILMGVGFVISIVGGLILARKWRS